LGSRVAEIKGVRLKEGSRNVRIDIASIIVLAFGTVDFWISLEITTLAQHVIRE
jgi:hypothetical protein